MDFVITDLQSRVGQETRLLIDGQRVWTWNVNTPLQLKSGVIVPGGSVVTCSRDFFWCCFRRRM